MLRERETTEPTSQVKPRVRPSAFRSAHVSDDEGGQERAAAPRTVQGTAATGYRSSRRSRPSEADCKTSPRVSRSEGGSENAACRGGARVALSPRRACRALGERSRLRCRPQPASPGSGLPHPRSPREIRLGRRCEHRSQAGAARHREAGARCPTATHLPAARSAPQRSCRPAATAAHVAQIRRQPNIRLPAPLPISLFDRALHPFFRANVIDAREAARCLNRVAEPDWAVRTRAVKCSVACRARPL